MNRHTTKTRLFAFGPLLLGLAAVGVMLPCHAAPDSPSDIGWLRHQVGDGAVAYTSEKKKRLFLVELADNKVQDLGEGQFPEFSPDSSKLAWIKGDQAVGRERRGDGTVHVIAKGVEPEGAVHWISDGEVVVRMKGGKWRRVKLTGGSEPVPELNAMGFTGREADVKRCADGVWVYTAGRQWKTSDGKSGRIPGNCSTSFSPDGLSIGALQAGHKEFKFVPIREGGAKGKLKWVYAGPKKNKGFDNHRWSSNDERFFVFEDEKFGQPAVMMIGQTKATRIGDQPNPGDNIYGDLTVGDGSGGPWPERDAAVAKADPEPGGEPAKAGDQKRVRLVGRLVEKSPVPDADNYPNALVVYVYDVKRVVDGRWPESNKRVLVAHWAVRKKQVNKAIRDRRVGQNYPMTLEPFDAHPDLATHQIALPGDEAILDADLWFAVK